MNNIWSLMKTQANIAGDRIIHWGGDILNKDHDEERPKEQFKRPS